MTPANRSFKANAEGGHIGRLFAVWAAAFAIALTGCQPHDFPQYAPNYREYAYVTNGESGTVSVFDVVNVRLDREIAVGHRPVAVVASPTRNEVYVVNAGAPGGPGSLSIVDAEKNSVAATIPLHHEPVSIDVDGEHELAYVANSGSNSVSAIDLKARREIAQIGTGEQPMAAVVSPDSRTVVVPNRSGNSVSIIDTRTQRVRAIFEGCPGANNAVILPDSSKAFVACSGGHQVMAIALADSKFNPGGPDQLESMMDVGRGPVQLALKPDGGELFVSNSQSNTISEVVTTKDDVGGAYLMGDYPTQGIVTSDNSLLYVSNLHSSEVTIYSIEEGKRVRSSSGSDSIHVGDGPSAMAFSATGHLLFVVDSRSGDVAVVRTASQSLFTMLPAGRGPNAIAVKSFRGR